MLERNLLRQGEFVVPVPAGMPCVLEYDQFGVICKVYRGFDNHGEIWKEIDQICEIASVPKTIQLQGGTTRVIGVIVDPSIYDHTFGSIEAAFADAVAKNISADPGHCKFLAGTVESLAAKFNGYSAIKLWLQTNMFDPLGGFIIGQKNDDDTLVYSIIRAGMCEPALQFPFISDYLVFNASGMRRIPTGISQYLINSCECKVSSSGTWYGSYTRATSDDVDSQEYRLPYSMIIKFNIQPGTRYVVDKQGNVLQSWGEDMSNLHQCPNCHKMVNVPENGPTLCDNDYCTSRLYPRIHQMLSKFNQPVISFQDFEAYIKDGSIQSLLDIFMIPQYCNSKVDISLSTAISALVPNSDSCEDAIRRLCNNCKDDLDTLIYYLNNVDSIYSDFRMNLKLLDPVRDWFSNDLHINELEDLIHIPNITLVQNTKLFEGAPIFFGKTVTITGDFIRGTHSRIFDILSSYSATVVEDDISNSQYLVTGSKQENVNGSLVQAAKLRRIPVVDENTFFELFDIDSDLALNL